MTNKNKINDGKNFVEIGQKIGKLVQEKNAAYGDSFSDCGKFLTLLYPDGVHPEQYTDMLCIVRMFDKMKRIATDKDWGNEDPWNDLAGYSILGIEKEERRKKR